MKVNIGLHFSIVRVCDKLLWLSLEEMHRAITLSDNKFWSVFLFPLSDCQNKNSNTLGVIF